jgi:transcriptional regulator with GAF, ATPase, and Fis domain
VPVILEGETGTGKEVLAESLHDMSPRAGRPFVILDCAAVSAGLAESELFGHERGAFTGALDSRKGVFEEAHGGTLLLDEIGELPLHLQTKLLRALDSRVVKRVGGSRFIPVDVRVMGATRRNLDLEVQAGRFRDDLFHRLVGARVELPSLRDRKGDIALLARYFATQLGGDEHALPPSLLARWRDHTWPGNVRELRNAVARYLAMGDIAEADAWEAFPMSSHGPGPTSVDTTLRLAEWVDAELAKGGSFVGLRKALLEEFERSFLSHALAAHGGNIARAASAAGIGRRYFQKLQSRKKSEPAP